MSPTSARERLITGAIALMRRQGAAGMGISELIAESGVARRSLYLNFPGGKDELVAEATAVAGRHVSLGMRSADDPVVLLRAFVDSWRTVLVDSDFTAGCPVGAAALAGDSAPSAPRAAGEAFTVWRRKIADRLEAAGLPADEAGSLGYLALSAVEGAVLLAIAERSLDAIDAIDVELARLLESRLQG